MFIVINDDWKKKRWLRNEKQFLKDHNIHIVFTCFDNDWEKSAASEILTIMFSKEEIHDLEKNNL